MIKLVQGDSYLESIISPDYPTFDNAWTGRWAIVTELGAAAVCSGNLTIASDNKSLLLTIPPGATDAVPPGEYILVAEAVNATIGFRQEFKQAVLKLGKQGLPAVSG